MIPAQRDRWRIHRAHCTAQQCWGPDTCKQCIEIGNTPKPKTGDGRQA